jgi:hypothetical protein
MGFGLINFIAVAAQYALQQPHINKVRVTASAQPAAGMIIGQGGGNKRVTARRSCELDYLPTHAQQQHQARRHSCGPAQRQALPRS